MTAEYVPIGVPFLRSLNIRRHRVDRADLMFISNEFHQRLRKSKLSPGDVVVVRTGEPGVAAVIPDDLQEANCADLVIIRPSAAIDARYLAYYVNGAAQAHISGHLVGAVQQHFNVGSAKTLPITLPPIQEQRAIASALGLLDEKIENNRKVNRTLEAMSQVLFKSWFVDFDPVVAKRQGQRPSGLEFEYETQFPAHFQESNLGPIPEGWRISTIGTEVRVVGGSTPRTNVPGFWEGGSHCWVTPRDMSRLSDPVVLDSERSITDAGLAQIGSGLLPIGTVLLSSRAPIGYTAIAAVPLAINQGFIAMCCEGALGPQFVLRWTHDSMEEIVARAGGTTFAEISKATFRSIPLVVPNESVARMFEAKSAVWHEQIVRNVSETRALVSLRDLLLPKLLSGEVRLGDVERIVGAAI